MGGGVCVGVGVGGGGGRGITLFRLGDRTAGSKGVDVCAGAWNGAFGRAFWFCETKSESRCLANSAGRLGWFAECGSGMI